MPELKILSNSADRLIQRGGEGNIYKEKYGGHSAPVQEKDKEKHHEKESLGDKVKHLFGKKD